MFDWIFDVIAQLGYAGVLLLMLAETVFPPIPSEVIMPVAGVLAARGSMSIGGIIAAGTIGAMLGNLFWYLLARIIGVHRFKPLLDRHGRWLTMDWYEVEKAERLFGRFGSAIVFVGRMLPTVRTIISIPAGLLRMHLGRFFLWSAAGTAIWSSGLAVAGYMLGARFQRIEDVLGPLSTGVALFIVIAYVWRQATWHKRNPAQQQRPELPDKEPGDQQQQPREGQRPAGEAQSAGQ